MTNENETFTTLENSNGPIASDPVKQLTIGELFKIKREEKKLSLKVISQQTKIHVSLLENLEANNLSALPSKAYVQGFVRSTSKILNINTEEALNALEYTYNPDAVVKANAVGLKKKKQIESEHEKEDFKNKESILLAQNFITRHIGLFTKVGFVLLILGGTGYFVTDYIQKLPPPVVTEETQVEETTNASIDANGLVQNTAPAIVTPEPTTTTETTTPVVEEKKAEEVKTETIAQTEEKETQEAVDAKTLKQVRLTTVSPSEVQFADEDLTTEDYNEFLPAKFRVNVAPGTHAIFLNATKGDSWVTYKVDDKEIKKFVLRQGRTLFLRGNMVRLFLGNSSSLNVFYNNRPVTIVSRGKSTVKNVVVPDDKRASFKTPLFIFNDDGTVLTSDEYEKIMSTQAL